MARLPSQIDQKVQDYRNDLAGIKSRNWSYVACEVHSVNSDVNLLLSQKANKLFIYQDSNSLYENLIASLTCKRRWQGGLRIRQGKGQIHEELSCFTPDSSYLLKINPKAFKPVSQMSDTSETLFRSSKSKILANHQQRSSSKNNDWKGVLHVQVVVMATGEDQQRIFRVINFRLNVWSKLAAILPSVNSQWLFIGS